MSSGPSILPLVIVLGPACTSCDKKGETTCSQCGGTGTRSGFLNPDHDYPCEPRERCSSCGGLKYLVNTSRFGKGSCAHEKPVMEMQVGDSELRRCPRCGLAALSTGGYWVDMFACGVCGQFACRCRY